jgi:hypothetical protein
MEGKLLCCSLYDHTVRYCCTVTSSMFLSQLNAIYVPNGECMKESMKGEGSFNLLKSIVYSTEGKWTE